MLEELELCELNTVSIWVNNSDLPRHLQWNKTISVETRPPTSLSALGIDSLAKLYRCCWIGYLCINKRLCLKAICGVDMIAKHKEISHTSRTYSTPKENKKKTLLAPLCEPARHQEHQLTVFNGCFSKTRFMISRFWFLIGTGVTRHIWWINYWYELKSSIFSLRYAKCRNGYC